jgi:hypothetical protein
MPVMQVFSATIGTQMKFLAKWVPARDKFVFLVVPVVD